MIEEITPSPRKLAMDDLDPLLCDSAIAHEYSLFQFNNLATTIVGHAQLALNNPTYESLKRSAQMASEYGQRVADIARSLMVLSKGSASETTQNSLNDLLSSVATLAQEKLSRSGIALSHRFGDAPPVQVDAASIREVFANLLGRAPVASAHNGGAAIHLSTERGDNLVRVLIRYSGLSISREMLDDICVPLFNAHCVAGATGGNKSRLTVDVKQEDVHETLVVIGIPCTVAPSLKRSARVLVVDDEPVILSIFGRFISRAGHMVDTASGGREALEKIRDNAYDIVLLDWMMPEVAGADVLREGTVLRPGLPFVVVTAAYSRELAARAVDAGAMECIGKPLNHKKVLYLIEKYSGTVRPAEAVEGSPTEGQGEVLLVAESDQLTRDLYHLVFDHAGYETVMVSSYEEAAAAVEREYHDAILLNISLLGEQAPAGIKTLRRLNPYTPILIIGDHPDESERQRSLSAGAAAFLEKPLEIRRFLLGIRTILDLYKEPSASRYKV